MGVAEGADSAFDGAVHERLDRDVFDVADLDLLDDPEEFDGTDGVAGPGLEQVVEGPRGQGEGGRDQDDGSREQAPVEQYLHLDSGFPDSGRRAIDGASARPRTRGVRRQAPAATSAPDGLQTVSG